MLRWKPLFTAKLDIAGTASATVAAVVGCRGTALRSAPSSVWLVAGPGSQAAGAFSVTGTLLSTLVEFPAAPAQFEDLSPGRAFVVLLLGLMLNMESIVFFPPDSLPASKSETHRLSSVIRLESPPLLTRFRCPAGNAPTASAQWPTESMAVGGGSIDVTDVGCNVIIMTSVV